MATHYRVYERRGEEKPWQLICAFDSILSAKEFLSDCRTEDKLLRIHNCEYKIEENTD